MQTRIARQTVMNLVVFLCLARTGKAKQPNLLLNPGFEMLRDGRPVGWRVEKGGWGVMNSADGEMFRSGKWCVRVTCPPGVHHETVISEPIEVEQNKRYLLSFWSKSDGGSHTYGLAWFHGKLESQRHQSGGIVPGPHDWVRSQFIFKTPPRTERMEVRLGIKYGGTAWFDDVLLREAGVDETENLLMNSSFEYSANPGYPDCWMHEGYSRQRKYFGRQYWGLDETVAYHGSKSLRVSAPLQTFSVWYEGVKAPCTFSVFVRSNRLRARFRLRCGNASTTFAVGPGWQRCSVRSTAHSGVLTVSFGPIKAERAPEPGGIEWTERGRFGKAVVMRQGSRLGVVSKKEAIREGTIEFWMKPAYEIPGSMRKDIALLSRDNCRPYLYIDRRGRLVWSIYDGKREWSLATEPSVWEEDKWYHIAVEWGAKGQCIYLNGTERARNPRFTGTYEYRGNQLWMLGKRGDIDVLNFEGALDELRISSKQRSVDEIEAGSSAKAYRADEDTVLLLHFDREGEIEDWSVAKPQTVFWVDAAQLEEAEEPTAYRASWRDVLLRTPPEGPEKSVTIRLIRGDAEMYPARSLRVDGETIIPVWIWGLRPEDCAKLMKFGVNTAFCAKDWMEEARRYGLKVIYCLPSAWRIREKGMSREDLLRLIREEVVTLRDDPSVICWFTCDEPKPEKGLTQTLLSEIHRTVKSTGAPQPIYLNCSIRHYAGAERDTEFVKNHLLGFIPSADIVSLDPYPVPRSPLAIVTLQTDLLRGHAPDKVVGMILQFFMGGRFWREPTPAELTAMWYMALIHGARVIGLYSRRPIVQELWEAMKGLARETKELTPVLTSAERCEISRQEPDPYASGIHCLVRMRKGKLYLIATNSERRRIRCRFVVEGMRSGSRVVVLFEGRKLVVERDSFGDLFRPYGRHIYELESR